MKGDYAMKKFLFSLIFFSLLFAAGTHALAIELTDEYINEHGIPAVDEAGRATILIPLYTREIAQDEMHTETLFPGDIAAPAHFVIGSLHAHHITNVRTIASSQSKPISKWADEGFTISWTEGWSLTFSLTLDLKSGISKGQVEQEFGISVGGSYTASESNTYTAPPIPAGYQGRISLQILYNHYIFDDRIEYYSEYNPSLKLEETILDNTADGHPYSEVVYLELLPK